MEIEVIRSTKRKKTVQAKIVDNRIVFHIPHRMTKTEEKRVIDELSKKLLARKQLNEINIEERLFERAKKLNKEYFENRLPIKSIEFVNNQKRCFGTCNVRSGVIRISERLNRAPKWVLDYVIIHELAHLIHPNHSKKFWECVYRYPLTERARGYLIAISLEEDDSGYQENEE